MKQSNADIFDIIWPKKNFNSNLIKLMPFEPILLNENEYLQNKQNYQLINENIEKEEIN